MERIEVESSNIKSGGYNPESRVLELEFVRKSAPDSEGPVYQYDGVPPEKWQGFLASPSKGRYFGAEIKGHYQTTKVSA